MENEDTGKWKGQEKTLTGPGGGIKQPLTDDSLGTTKHAQQTVFYLLTH